MFQSKNVGYLTVVLFYLIFAKIAKKGGKWEPGSKFRYKHSIIKWQLQYNFMNFFFRDQIKYLNEMRHKNNLMYVILLCMYYKRRTVIYSYILDKVKVEEVVQDIFCQNAIISGDEQIALAFHFRGLQKFYKKKNVQLFNCTKITLGSFMKCQELIIASERILLQILLYFVM